MECTERFITKCTRCNSKKHSDPVTIVFGSTLKKWNKNEIFISVVHSGVSKHQMQLNTFKQNTKGFSRRFKRSLH